MAVDRAQLTVGHAFCPFLLRRTVYSKTRTINIVSRWKCAAVVQLLNSFEGWTFFFRRSCERQACVTVRTCVSA